jgi:dTDP-4-amino-4,6-dideoxygalactose transaminase
VIHRLADLPLSTPATRDYGEPVYHLYIVRTPRRDDVMAALRAEDIATAVYYPVSLHLQKALRFLGYEPGDLPVAEAAQDETFAIPAFPGITRAQQEAVARVVRAVLA